MKYSYFCPSKAGKYFIREQFWYNNKTHAFMCTGDMPMFVVISTSDGQFDWYWEDSSGRLVQASHKVDLGNISFNHDCDEYWFPVETEGKYHMKNFLRDPDINASRTCPGMFSQCFPHAFEADILVNPLVMLGYGGVLGEKKLSKLLCNRTPNLENIPLDYVINELRQRKNVITHKENMYELARNFFIGCGHLPYKNPHIFFTDTEEKYVHETTKLINQNRQFEKDIANLLDYYDIPYEWFNLDTDDYCEVFGLEKAFRKDEDPTLDYIEQIVDKETSDKWISDYVKNYP
tara:strand:+ start:413 stop:1282 length:870 start_codon:yes stop_codon:yes gene_type:complete